MLPPSRNGETEESIEEAAHRERKDRKAEQTNHTAAITASLAAINDQLKTHNERQDRNEKPKKWFDIATAAFVFATAVFSGLAWCVFRGQLHEMERAYAPIEQSALAAQNSLKLAYQISHPPILRLTNPAIWQKGGPRDQPPDLDDPRGIDGRAYLQNLGSSTATIRLTKFMALWYKDLPMWRPYNDMESDTEKPANELPPLGYAEFKNVIIPPRDDENLFFLGYAYFGDPSGTQGNILFAWRYDAGLRHFVRVKDRPEYDTEE
jgi:hypothetical protein